MVEQAHAGEGHCHAPFVALGDDQIIADRAAGLGNIGYAGSGSPLDIIRKGEESIGAKSNALEAGKPLLALFLGKGLGTGGKIVLPDALGAYILFVAVDVAVDHIITIGTAQISTELEAQRLGMLTQEPGIGLGACQSGAMDSGLLT